MSTDFDSMTHADFFAKRIGDEFATTQKLNSVLRLHLGKKMEVSISARNGELPESSQNRIEDKVRKLPRYFDRVTAVQVIANFQSHQEPEIEIVVSVEGTSDIVASSKGSNIISACDAALQKIERQLKKHKEKITQHRATGHKHLSETNADEEE